MIPKLGALRFLGDRPALPQLSHGRQLHSQCTARLPRQLVTSWCQGSGPQRGRKGGLPRERQEGGKRGGEATAQGAGRCLLNGPQDQAPPHGRRPLPSTCSSRREGTLSSASSPPPTPLSPEEEEGEEGAGQQQVLPWEEASWSGLRGTMAVGEPSALCPQEVLPGALWIPAAPGTRHLPPRTRFQCFLSY